jgi:glycosyltransferase involved in cell wall biosynthesis
VPKTFLIVPCFNEAARLPAAEFAGLLARRPDLTLLFVDDGSTDGTADVVEALRAREGGRVELLRLPENGGKAEAVRRGLVVALEHGAELVGYADADLSTPASELERLLARMDAGAPAVLLASRVRLLGSDVRRHAHRHYLGRVFATLASLALGIPVYDTQCGAKLFRRTDALRAARATPFRTRWIFDVELLDRLLRGGPGAAPLGVEAFEELPLRAWRDVGGSKLRPFAMFVSGLQLIALAVRPRSSR